MTQAAIGLLTGGEANTGTTSTDICRTDGQPLVPPERAARYPPRVLHGSRDVTPTA
ncbi:hypothetical protein [Parafrankia sp. FMc2]|uniref:hypothetical protein n=1 Tax=Parafrankia sp. FMc2 TaxID=3233196 RepID=UPI0034D419B9